MLAALFSFFSSPKEQILYANQSEAFLYLWEEVEGMGGMLGVMCVLIF